MIYYIYAVCIHELQKKLVSIRKFNSLTACLAAIEKGERKVVRKSRLTLRSFPETWSSSGRLAVLETGCAAQSKRKQNNS